MKITAKQILSTLMALIFILCAVPITASAEEIPTSGVCGDNLTCVYDSNTQTLTISGTGMMYDYGAFSDKVQPWEPFESEIKNIIIENGVTSIGARAFDGFFEKLESIVIPDSVTFIDYEAFLRIDFDESKWEDGALYIGNHLIEVKETVSGDFSIKEGTVSVATEAFMRCDKITSVTIPDTVVGLGGSLFYGADNIETIHIPKSVSVIDENAFLLGSGIKNFTVDESNPILSVDENGVLFNKDKTKVIRYPIANDTKTYTMPDTVTTIGFGAFRDALKIDEVILSDALEAIGEYAFYNCSIKKLILPDSLKTIDANAFEGSYITGKLVLPDSMETIGAYAFSGCKGIESLDTGKGLTVITGNAFSGCSELDDITIGSSVTVIEDSAFTGTKTKDIYIPSTVIEVTADSLGSVRTLYCVRNSTAGRMWLYAATTKVYIDEVTSLKLNATTIKWNVGKSGSFRPIIEPEMAINKTLSWESSDESVATVSSAGKLTAVGAGTCVITCKTTDGSNLIATCNVTVTVPNPVTSVKLNVTSLTWGIGRSGSFKSTVSPADAADKSLTWTSSNTKVATVDANGKLTAVGVGTATITCAANDGSGKYATCKVTVKDIASNLKLNATTIKWAVGKSGSFKPTVSPEAHANQKLSWTSSNTKVATVNSNGKLTAVGVGTATITCKTTDGSNLKATCTVTVGKAVSSVKLNCSSLTWATGKSGSFKPTVAPSDAINKSLTWTSSNPSVAKIDANGKLTTLKEGTTTITCTAKDGSGKYATCKVTVSNKITSLKLNASSIVWEVGKSGSFKPTLTPSGVSTSNLEWTSLNPDVATVSSTGKLTAKAPGTATIICEATDGSGKYATCRVMVTKGSSFANYRSYFNKYFKDGTYAINGTTIMTGEDGKSYNVNMQIGITPSTDYLSQSYTYDGIKIKSIMNATEWVMLLPSFRASDHFDSQADAMMMGIPKSYYNQYKNYYMLMAELDGNSVGLDNLTYKSEKSKKYSGTTYLVETFERFDGETVEFYFYNGELKYVNLINSDDTTMMIKVSSLQGTFKISDFNLPSGYIEIEPIVMG